MSSLAIFLTSLDGGGAERAMVNLACGFVKQGLDVDLVLMKLEGPYLSLVSPEVRVVNLEGKRLLLSIAALVRYLQRERPRTLLSSLEDTNIVALWANRLAGVSTRIVVNVQNTLSQQSQNATEIKRRLTPQLVRWFYPWADAIVSVSQGVAEDLVRLGLPSECIKVIPNPVITPEFFQKIQEPLAHSWFSPGQPPVILGVGRLEKQKDFPTLIRAFAQVKQQLSVRLMILGEGKERPYLEALVQELGLTEDVALPGFVANPHTYMARSAIFVLSSLFEGLPTVLIEAMAAGTPVVSTNCKSGPAEILKNGQYGKLVAVGDVNGIAEAITSTLKEPPDPAISRKRVNEFSLERSLEQYSQVLQVG
ncbi:MAG: glycosyltransferase [Chroococcidiopsidaceae cyanobacterium CP_BM_ER_R8_30]|nr:glycosyltransferase [Chroococcidiopsidaceae cyanobacterium CP_BM_ER_R8_30]